MFQSLRPNSQIFVLHRGDSLAVDIGFVTNVSIPRPKFTPQPIIGKPQEAVVDISAKLGNTIVNYTNLDAAADIAESVSNGESLVIATSKDAMNSEIMNLKQKSIDIINSKEYHENLVQEYDKVLNSLNPEFAEKEQQKIEINALKEQVSQMTQNVEALMQANKALIEKLQKGNTV